MSLEKAKKYLTEQGYADHVIELEESSATVQLAAEALDDCEDDVISDRGWSNSDSYGRNSKDCES